MKATAQEYVQAHESEERDWRIDVVAVKIGQDGRLQRIDIVENAVEGLASSSRAPKRLN